MCIVMRVIEKMDDDLIRRINKIEREKRNASKRNRAFRNILYTTVIIGGLYCAYYNVSQEPPKKGDMRGSDTTMVDTNYVKKPIDANNVCVW